MLQCRKVFGRDPSFITFMAVIIERGYYCSNHIRMKIITTGPVDYESKGDFTLRTMSFKNVKI
jgi:hypothetical protein